MLSEETKQRIASITAGQSSYCPSAATKAKLGNKSLVMLVGATCMGKSTIMQALESRGSTIQVVGTTTTRPPRPDDAAKRYYYFEYSDAGLRPLFDDIEAGKLVQYIINPHSGFIYGSYPEDYPADVNIGDYFSRVVDLFQTYGFQKIIPITIITTPEQWRRRFDERFPTGHPECTARLSEAAESLEWSLRQPTMLWVMDLDGESQAAATSVEMAIRGELTENQAEAKELATGCLQLIKELSHV